MKKLIVLVALCLCCGCGTMLAGTREQILITSTPPGIEVLVDGHAHMTPANLMLERKDNHTVRFPNGQVVKIEKTFWGNGEHFLNLLWLSVGLVPCLVAGIIDELTGANNDLEPDAIEYRDGKVYDIEAGIEIPKE